MMAFFLAAAVVFHQALLGDWEVLSPHAALVLAAFWTLLRPGSPIRFFVLLTAIAIAWAVDMPAVVNHWMLLGVGIVAAFIALGWSAIRGERDLLDPGALFLRLAPYLRVLIVGLYFFAALAKVNDSFLEPALSCGAAMYEDLVGRFGLPAGPDWPRQAAIYGTIGIEAALPLMLALRRTRLLGVAAGVGFHTILALSGHTAFSSFAILFYALFLPDDMPGRVRTFLAENPRLAAVVRRVVATARAPIVFPLVSALFLVVAAVITYWPDVPSTRFRLEGLMELGAELVFYAYTAVLATTAAVVLLRSGRPFRYRPGFLRLAHPVWWLGPALIFVNAVSPYIGLKTQNSFTMYSNLQTENGRWNHALLPPELRVFSLQDDRVRIIDSDDPWLSAYAGSDSELVWFKFREYTADRPELRVTYERGGERRVVERAGDDPQLGRPQNGVLAKILFFRDVPPSDQNACRSRREYTPEQGS
jgi:hypothetical protein